MRRGPFSAVQIGALGQSGRAPVDPAYFDQVIAPKLGMKWFQEAAQVNVGAGASLVEVVAVTIPDGVKAVLRFFGHQLVNPANWSDLRWAIQRNGSPIHPWANIQMQLASPQSPQSVFEELTGGDTVRWVATSLGVAVNGAGGMLAGWWWRQR